MRQPRHEATRPLLREWRLYRGWTLEEVGARLPGGARDKSYVSRSELRPHRLKIDELTRFAEALELDHRDRLFEAPPINPIPSGVGEDGAAYEGAASEASAMSPLTIQLERLLEKYGHKQVADRLYELEAQRRTAGAARPRERR